eukprot:COSAG02_NODE_9652_length_2151_cov_1.664717_2_plen_193_part_00
MMRSFAVLLSAVVGVAEGQQQGSCDASQLAATTRIVNDLCCGGTTCTAVVRRYACFVACHIGGLAFSFILLSLLFWLSCFVFSSSSSSAAAAATHAGLCVSVSSVFCVHRLFCSATQRAAGPHGGFRIGALYGAKGRPKSAYRAALTGPHSAEEGLPPPMLRETLSIPGGRDAMVDTRGGMVTTLFHTPTCD